VPLASAADSLRWAEQALALASAGIIDGQVVLCEDLLVTMWLLSDSALADQVTRRQRSPAGCHQEARATNPPFGMTCLLSRQPPPSA
jgi:hypothetical protein